MFPNVGIKNTNWRTNVVRLFELEVGECVSHQQGHLQHSPEDSGVAAHRLGFRVEGEEGTLEEE